VGGVEDWGCGTGGGKREDVSIVAHPPIPSLSS